MTFENLQSLLKACPATRRSYKCAVNSCRIRASRESFCEMKLCLSSEIIMWYRVPQTVHSPDGKRVKIVLGGDAGTAEVIQAGFGVCV